MPLLLNSFIKVVDGVAVGAPFTLPTDYRAADGSTTTNIQTAPFAVKLSLGLYPVIETLPSHDASYQTLAPTCTVNADHVALTYTVSDQALADVKAAKLAEIYRHCAGALDGLARGYSSVEVAQFPLMQAEISAYNADNAVVGGLMQKTIARGRHTAASLSVLLTLKITAQEAALTARDVQVAAVGAMTDVAAVAGYAPA